MLKMGSPLVFTATVKIGGSFAGVVEIVMVADADLSSGVVATESLELPLSLMKPLPGSVDRPSSEMT